MSKRSVPARLLEALPAGDPIREALLAARAELPERARLERVYGSVIAAGGLGGGGGEGGGSDGDGLGDGGSPEPPPPIVAPSGASPFAAAGNGAAFKAASTFGATTLGKVIGVGLLGTASLATAVWIASPSPAPSLRRPDLAASAPVAAARDAAGDGAAPRPPRTIASGLGPAGRGRAGAVAPPSGSVVVDPAAEVALLREAQAAASGAPARALTLLDEAERRFPRSALGQERTVIRVQALIAAGRRDEALARARALLDANPGTAHRPRLEQMLPELTR